MLTIAWDVDDVLNDFTRTWFETHWLPEHPACSLSYQAMAQNPPAALLGVSLDEYRASIDAFRLSEKFTRMVPSREVGEWFRVHGASFRHLALTAVPLTTASASAGWVMRHFGSWIRTFHVVPSPRKTDTAPSYDRSKKDFLKWFGKVDIFVDDSEENLVGCDALGVRGIVFPRPWNKSLWTVAQTLHSLGETASCK